MWPSLFFLLLSLSQWAGAAVLGVGIWLAADQNSFLTLIKFTQSENAENIQVYHYHYLLIPPYVIWRTHSCKGKRGILWP